jgi:hypothetical protein
MPDPMTLKVGDRVRFISLPQEWDDPKYQVQPCSVRFMKELVARTWPSRVFRIDDVGTPWIRARFTTGPVKGYHEWGIMEHTGWRKVTVRS